MSHLADTGDDASVARFCAYLRMRTVHPDPTPGYREAISFFRGVAEAARFEFKEAELTPGHPLGIVTWRGSDDTLDSIILNTHMDVVPAELSRWTKEPFGAAIVDGKIYARGTQDMKGVAMQIFEALLRLRQTKFTPVRTIHMLLVPDEEVGGNRGIKLLLANPLIRTLRPALVLDEGLPSPDDKFCIYYGERKIWWLRVKVTGPAGHGSRFIKRTAVQKLHTVIDHVLKFRNEQEAELERTCGCGKQLGDFTTMNCTMLLAGEPSRFQYNVIPDSAQAGFDCRIPATVDLKAFKQQVDAWCSEEGVTWELVNGSHENHLDNPISSTDGLWWDAFTSALALTGIALHPPSIYPAATDSRWIRLALPDVPCFGFSPMRRTPVLLHDHDEFVPVASFLEGIGVYETLLTRLAGEVRDATCVK